MGLNWSTFFPFKNIISGSNLGKRVAKASIKSSSKTSTVDHPKTLIIAEKPSVANDIAKALGGFTKHEDYFESDDFVISSAVGHLLEIAAPEEFEVKRGKWSFANLPVVPPYFDLRPIAKTESRLKVLQRLIKRKDVTTLINACDAGREGRCALDSHGFNSRNDHAGTQGNFLHGAEPRQPSGNTGDSPGAGGICGLHRQFWQ
jgi:hypothetical protein